MQVWFGNDNAIEAVLDDRGEVESYRDAPGQRITEVGPFPEGYTVIDAEREAILALSFHLAQGAKPAWIESDDETLQRRLCEHYEIENTGRPEAWGETNGGESD